MNKFKQTMAKFGLAEEDPADLDAYENDYPAEEEDLAPSAELDPLKNNAFAMDPPVRSGFTHDNVSDFSLSTSRDSVLSAVKQPAPADLARIVTIHPHSFDDAPQIGSSLRDGVPVIVNLSGMGAPDQRRMVDFCAGVIFAINGLIERISKEVFLLSPASVEVVEEEGQPEGRRPRKF